MARKVLSVQYDYNFALFGIISQNKDYRLCYEINKALSITLQKTHNLLVSLPKQKSNNEFPMYYFENDTGTQFFLVNNKNEKGALLPEQKVIDYLLIIKGPCPEDVKKQYEKGLKKIQIVLGIYELKPETLKSKDNLLF